MNVLIKFAYNGKDFCGFQSQPRKRCVQSELESVLSSFFDEKITIFASGRTDSGVHAMGQCASFFCGSKNHFDVKKLPNAINTLLPCDIKIFSAKKVADDFNARFSAKKKTYLYKFYKADYDNPLKANLAVRVSPKINLEKMKIAIKSLLGEHDFSAFRASGAQNKDDNIREIYSVKLAKRFDEYHFEITGNGFLYNMVRIIVGTLFEIGEGKKNIDAFDVAFSNKNRNSLGKTANACGLYLKNVKYN